MDEINSIIRELYIKGAIMFGDFRLTSGLRSPYYIDLRRIYSYPDLLKSVINLYLSKLNELRYDVISGIESGSIAIAAILGYILNKPFIYVRKKPKSFGTMKLIEGVLKTGDEVVIVDDVATTGGSILHAIDAIEASGGIVKYAVVLIDRLQGASENISRKGVSLKPIVDISYVVETLYNYRLIDDMTYEKLNKYIGGGYAEG